MKLYSWSSNLTRLSCLAPHIRGFGSHHGLLYAAFRRGYATQSTLGGSTTPSRKQITISNDDGRVQWKDLSRREKAARTTQQTFNLGLVLLGFFMTGGVVYFLYKEVFSGDSKTSHFNRAVDRIRSDPRAAEVLGSGSKIRAFGEPTSSKWARSRPIASRSYKEKDGTENFLMHFNVEGPLRSGVVNLHLFRRPGQSDFEYKYLALDVKDHTRIYVEKADSAASKNKTGLTMFGVKWR